MEGINDANITPSRRMLRVRVKKTPPPDFCTSSTPGSRSAQRRGAGKELTKPFWTKLSHQKGKVRRESYRNVIVNPHLTTPFHSLLLCF